MTDRPDYPERDGSRQLANMIREAISNAYYEARNKGETMEAAANNATASVMKIVASVDENAHKRGEAHGYLEAFTDIDRVADDVLDARLGKDDAVGVLNELRKTAVARMEAIT